MNSVKLLFTFKRWVVGVASVFNALAAIFLNFVGLKRYSYGVFHVYSRRGFLGLVRSVGFRVVSYGLVPTRLGFYNHLVVLVKSDSLTANKRALSEGSK